MPPNPAEPGYPIIYVGSNIPLLEREVEEDPNCHLGSLLPGMLPGRIKGGIALPKLSDVELWKEEACASWKLGSNSVGPSKPAIKLFFAASSRTFSSEFPRARLRSLLWRDANGGFVCNAEALLLVDWLGCSLSSPCQASSMDRLPCPPLLRDDASFESNPKPAL